MKAKIYEIDHRNWDNRTNGRSRRRATHRINWPNLGCLALVAAFWIALLYFAVLGVIG